MQHLHTFRLMAKKWTNLIVCDIMQRGKDFLAQLRNRRKLCLSLFQVRRARRAVDAALKKTCPLAGVVAHVAYVKDQEKFPLLNLKKALVTIGPHIIIATTKGISMPEWLVLSAGNRALIFHS
ncbi:MAG: hypothetical protein WC878_01605 [Candidatus Paceibacterota bacterium]|jgi:hypothetical protein